MTPPIDLYNIARLIATALYYELPGDKGELYWTNGIANRLGVFRSHCLAKQVSDKELPIRIRAQARVLRDYLGLGDLGPYPRLSSLAMLEGALCEVVNASDAVRDCLSAYHELITANTVDQATHDTLGFADDWELPYTCGEVDLRIYHTLFQQ